PGLAGGLGFAGASAAGGLAASGSGVAAGADSAGAGTAAAASSAFAPSCLRAAAKISATDIFFFSAMPLHPSGVTLCKTYVLTAKRGHRAAYDGPFVRRKPIEECPKIHCRGRDCDIFHDLPQVVTHFSHRCQPTLFY